MQKQNIQLANQLGLLLKQNQLQIATAESCTGGGIAQVITEIPGSSAWFDRGFVTYSNQSKVEMLKVKTDTLDLYGAVSEQTAIEMAEGAFHNSLANLTVSVTGIAGPEGGTDQKPVGTVYIAVNLKDNKLFCQNYHFVGTRTEIRQKTVKSALKLCIEYCMNI